MNGDVKTQLEKEAKVPPWVSGRLAPVLGLAFLLAELFELPERIGFERPASGLIMASVGGFLIWTWIVRYVQQWRPVGALLVLARALKRVCPMPRALIAALRRSRKSQPVVLWLVVILIGGCTYAARHIWLVYTSQQSWLFDFAILAALGAVAFEILAASHDQRQIVATYLGGFLAVVVLLVGCSDRRNGTS